MTSLCPKDEPRIITIASHDPGPVELKLDDLFEAHRWLKNPLTLTEEITLASSWSRATNEMLCACSSSAGAASCMWT